MTIGPGPRWVSLTFGTFVCADCANALSIVIGKQLANLRCVDLTFHYFGPEAIQVFKTFTFSLSLSLLTRLIQQFLRDVGNKLANEMLEARVNPPERKPFPSAEM